MKEAFKAGINPIQFWELSPLEVIACREAFLENEIEKEERQFDILTNATFRGIVIAFKGQDPYAERQGESETDIATIKKRIEENKRKWSDET